MAAAERRTDEQKEQQQIVLDYVADRGCDVVGLGDTRLGDGASEVSRMARAVLGRANDESLSRRLGGLSGPQRAIARTQHGKAAQASWRLASHRDEKHIWRGGVALGSYGDAALREGAIADDARGWGRYCERIYL